MYLYAFLLHHDEASLDSLDFVDKLFLCNGASLRLQQHAAIVTYKHETCWKDAAWHMSNGNFLKVRYGKRFQKVG